MPSVSQVPSNIQTMTDLVTRLKSVNFSAVPRDRAKLYIATQCTNSHLTPIQAQVVIQNVLG